MTVGPATVGGVVPGHQRGFVVRVVIIVPEVPVGDLAARDQPVAEECHVRVVHERARGQDRIRRVLGQDEHAAVFVEEAGQTFVAAVTEKPARQKHTLQGHLSLGRPAGPRERLGIGKGLKLVEDDPAIGGRRGEIRAGAGSDFDGEARHPGARHVGRLAEVEILGGAAAVAGREVEVETVRPGHPGLVALARSRRRVAGDVRGRIGHEAVGHTARGKLVQLLAVADDAGILGIEAVRHRLDARRVDALGRIGKNVAVSGHADEASHFAGQCRRCVKGQRQNRNGGFQIP